MKAVLLEVILVALIGGPLAFLANGLSPRGLKLTQDFFPGAHGSPEQVSLSDSSSTNANVAKDSSRNALAEQLRHEGLQMVESNEAARLFHDPARELDLILFLDARDDSNYQAGHIPGAYQFDHYHAENYLAAVLPLSQRANQVIVYCHGGDCEDSRFAAILLRDAGIPKEKLFVYVGGITEWRASGLPVELGARNSGSLALANQSPEPAPK